MRGRKRALARSEVNELESADLALLELQFEEGFLLVKALSSAGSGIEVENPGPISLSFDLVRMTVNQDLAVFDPLGLDVGHPKIDAHSSEALVFGELGSHFGPVDIAVDGEKGSIATQLIGDLQVAQVTGVPNLVTAKQMRFPSGVKVAMRIGE